MSFFCKYKISIGHILRNRIVGSKTRAFKMLVDVVELPVVSTTLLGFLDGSAGKELACSAAGTGGMGAIPGLGRYSGEGNCYPLQHSEKSHEQGSLAGHGSMGLKASDTTE